MVLGGLIVLVGIYIAFSGIISHIKPNTTTLNLIPNYSGLFKLAYVIAGGVVGLQGLFLAAIGQGLWLLATIARETEMASDYLYEILNNTIKTKQ
jgi:hypothetical protein